MKNLKLLTLLIALITFTNCSNEDGESENIIIGKWNFEASFDQNGTNENIDDCEKRSIITFRTDNTFQYLGYVTINNDCVFDGENKGEFKLENGILEIASEGVNSNEQTTIYVSRLKIVFTNSDTFEISEANSSEANSSDSSKDVFKRAN